MRRLIPLLLSGLIAVTALAGCSSEAPTSLGVAPDVAMKVDDWTLPKTDFLDELQQVAKNKVYVDARTAGNGGQPYQVFKPGTNDPDPTVAAEFLNELVSFRLTQAELQKKGIAVTDADRQQAVALLGSSLQRAQQNLGTPPGSSPSTTAPASTTTTVPDPAESARLGQSVLDGFTGSYKQTLLDGVSSLVALQRSLMGGGDTEQQIKDLYENTKEESCVSHILIKPSANSGKLDPQTNQPIVASDAEYQAALVKATGLRASLVGGADFATVAQQSSDDASSKDKGGDLGCRPRKAYVDAFDDAVWNLPLNTVSEPIKTNLGYHLILVREKRLASFDEARPALVAAVQQEQGQRLQQWLDDATKSAVVQVNPLYGVWDPAQGTITPAGGGQGANLGLSPLDSAPGTTR